MIQFPSARLTLGVSAALVLGLLGARSGVLRDSAGQKGAPPRLSVAPAEWIADGYDPAVLTIVSTASAPPRISFDRPHRARIEDLSRIASGWQARLRAGVLPGPLAVRVQFPGSPASTATVTLLPDTADSFSDGTPDFLRLSGRDAQAFRRWFTFLAEAQYFQEPSRRPAEIDDCAALIRYAYREALHAHDSAWAQSAALPLVPALDSVARYEYPFTPLGAALFRLADGPYSESDAGSSAFAQFADAQTLLRRNTYRIGRDLARALPGDLLFFHQPTGDMPFHSMIDLGPSQLRPDGERYILYHTGAEGSGRTARPGEIRRWTVAELRHYPETQWRPVDSNPAFLGVYRWNILRKVGEE